MFALHRLLLPVTLSSMLISFANVAEPVILESHVISHIDGLFIKADLIECMQKTRKELIAIIEEHGLHTLAKNEISQPHLACDALPGIRAAKKALEKIVHRFAGSARNAKSLLITLIKEDCHKRNRLDSPLLDWAQTPEEHEITAFESNMTNAHVLYAFCVDLTNFLHDLIQSCPKACALFAERRAKEHCIFKLLPAALEKQGRAHDTQTTIAFFKFIKKEHIDTLRLENITHKTVEELLADYIEKTESHS